MTDSNVTTEPEPSTEGSRTASAQRTVLRNTMFLTAAQVASIPISILTGAITARYLGARSLGYMYLGTTFNSFGFLAVDWGQSGAIPALVAKNRSRAAAVLGTSLIWRVAMASLVYVVLYALCRILGYDADVRTAVELVFLGYVLSTVVNAFQYTMIGFERTDVAAYRQVLEQLVALVILACVLLLGGGLSAVLLGNAATMIVVLAYIAHAFRRVDKQPLVFDRGALRDLFGQGMPFGFLGLAMVMQPNIDAVFLSKLASAEVVGWHSVARRLIGVLLFPANAIIGGLYPTMCRLHSEDSTAFSGTLNAALRGTSLLVVPVAVGCALFPDLGIAIYNRESFAPAENNLRVLSLFVFLVYFTMPLGIAVTAAGKQRLWAIVQSLCVVVSVILDPLLIPWFQRRTGNGGLGICVAAVASELVVLGFGIALAPPGVFDRKLGRSLLLAVGSGGVMAAVTFALKQLSPFFVAPLAVAAYVGTLWLIGGIDDAYVHAIRRFVRRKILRKADMPNA